MTNAPAAISAQLVDVRNVSSHKCVRLEIHVPAEQAGLVMAAFGWPTMADPVPVALARLQTAPEPIAKPTLSERETVQKERRPFSELPYSTQAAMRCNETEFWKFLSEFMPDRWDAVTTHYAVQEDAAAELIRVECRVASRSDIKAGSAAGKLWEALEAEYWAWQRGAR